MGSGCRSSTYRPPTDRDEHRPPGTFCFLHGTHSPFDAATLQRLYPSDARYANAVIASTVRNRAAGYMTRFDARWTIEDALRSLVPARGEGAVRAVSYRSRVLGETRRMQVYTPPGYATSKRRYPVLYLIHGGGDDDTGWLVKGGAKAILDEAIAREAAEPMIVVMPDARVGTDLGAPVTEDPFPRELVRAIVPEVESRFRAERGARSRALAGLSLGGVQVLDTLLQHPGAFAELSAWSTGWFPAQIADLADRPWLLRDPRINAGTQSLELRLGTSDFAYPNMTATRALFDELGVRYEYGETPGGHEWPVWQRYLRELVPRLFDYELPGPLRRGDGRDESLALAQHERDAAERAGLIPSAPATTSVLLPTSGRLRARSALRSGPISTSPA